MGVGIVDGTSMAYVVSSGGSTTQAGRVLAYNIATGTSTLSGPAPSPPTNSFLTGGMNPVNGWFYLSAPFINGSANSSFALYAYNPANGTAAPIRVGTVNGALGNNGDLAFDSQGNLYILSGNIASSAAAPRVYRVDASVVLGGTGAGSGMPATPITPSFPTDKALNYGGLAFVNGEMLVSSGDNYQRRQPSSGALISEFTNTAATGYDLASCQSPNTIRLQKDLRDWRVSATDQFQLLITGGGITQGNTATTTGSASGIQSAIAGPVLGQVGMEYTITETAANGANLDSYTTSVQCVNETTGNAVAVTPNATNRSATFIMPSSGAMGSNILCTFTNTVVNQPPFAGCTADMYLSQGPSNTTPTRLSEIVTTTNPLTFPVIGQGVNVYNSIGFSPLDNYLYGINFGGGTGNRLIRIGADGSTLDLGQVTGLPSAEYVSGTFDDEGRLYVMAGRGVSRLYIIDVGSRSATPLNLTESVNASDFAWIGGLIYAVEQTSGQLRSINPATGQVTNIGNPQGGMIFGAMFGSPTGLFGNYNGGGFYRIDLDTGVRTLISASPGAYVNDGANCPTAPITFAADLAITKDDGDTTYVAGTDVVYTIVVSNNGPFGAQAARVLDALPAGIATATWTCTAANGAACHTASGTGAIDALVDLPFNTSGVAATATFTLTMSVPSDFTGDLTNTARVEPGQGTQDPDMSNNEDEDTNVAPMADLVITKTNNEDEVSVGAATTYVVQVTNNGPSSADNAVLRDEWSAQPGLDCSTATWPGPGPAASCEASGAATTQCPDAGAVTPEALQAGIVIPVLPNGGVVTFTLQCRVTATGE